MRAALGCSERRACKTIGQHRSTQRKPKVIRDDEAALTADIIRLASEYGRYGYRRITALLRREGWTVNFKRVERIWRREGLKVPQKQPKRGRLWFNDGSCVRLRPQLKGHVWSYDFVADRTHDGRAFRTRHGPPEYIRSDNGSEFTAIAVREWLEKVKVQTFYITPGSPWGETRRLIQWINRGSNGYNERFRYAVLRSNGKLRDELLNGEIFYTLKEAQILIKRWRHHYNTIRPHSSLGYDHPHQKQSCHALLACPTLRSGQPNRADHNRQTLT